MTDYKEMYLHLFRETEKAARILQQAQLDCEEIYINTSGPKPVPLEGPEEPESEPDFEPSVDIPL